VCKGPEATVDREVNFPFLRGWLVRPGWDTVEPAAGRYDWAFLDNEVATARRLKKQIALCVLGGPQAPAWLYPQGAAAFRYTWGTRYKQGQEATLPLLWDETYLRHWTALVRELGRRYGDEPVIALVHVTGATENGLEMQLPAAAADRTQWRQVGYSPEKAVAAWKRIVDAFAEAFPHKPLDLDIHPVLGSDRVAEEVVAYAHGKLGGHFGVYGGWLSGKDAGQDRYHAGMHALAQQYGRQGFAAFQLIGNETRQPERFVGGVRGAVDQGMSWGARYFEVWRADVLNPQMHAKLQEVATLLETK
jgi:hypothetical protein